MSHTVGKEECITKPHQETLGCDGHIHGFDCGDGFLDTCVYQISSNLAFSMSSTPPYSWDFLKQKYLKNQYPKVPKENSLFLEYSCSHQAFPHHFLPQRLTFHKQQTLWCLHLW